MEEQQARKYQRILERKKEKDWVEVVHLAAELDTSYRGSPEDESVGEIRKLGIYALGNMRLEEGNLEGAYHEFYSLYERDPNYEDVDDLCASTAFKIGIRKDGIR